MSRPDALTMEQETKIVALIARGDSYDEIIEEFIKTDDRDLRKATITAIKQRNTENLATIKSLMLEKATADAMVIKQKANSKLDKKLTLDDTRIQVLTKAHTDYINGDIDFKAYSKIVDRTREMSVGELVSISKEMHNQSKEDTAPPVNNAVAEALMEAIKNGDEVKIQQIIFGSNNAQPDTPTT